VLLWRLDAEGAAPREFAGQLSSPTPLAFSPDGSALAVFGAAPEGLRLHDPAEGRPLPTVPDAGGTGEAVAFSPDGRLLAAAAVEGTARSVRLLAAATGKLRRHFPGHDGGTEAVALTSDGRLLLTAGRDGVVRLWEVATAEKRREWKGHPGGAFALAVSPDGTTVATAGADGRARLWSLYPRRGSPATADHSTGRMNALWQELAADAAGADAAVSELIGLGPAAVPFLAERLGPAAEVDAGRVQQLLADLDGRRFQTRRRAQHELRDLGAPALPALKEVLDGRPSLEMRRRVEGLVEEIEAGVPPAAQARALRAVEVLEHAGTADARRLPRRRRRPCSGLPPVSSSAARLGPRPGPGRSPDLVEHAEVRQP
jgi:hypothetical protein